MRAAADGPFFPDWEFHTLFGIQREQLRQMANEWPVPKLPPQEVVPSVNNSLNWLLTYPHNKYDLWSDWISADPATVKLIFDRLRANSNETPFDRMM